MATDENASIDAFPFAAGTYSDSATWKFEPPKPNELTEAAGALLAGFVAKDLALFPWLRRAYENRPSRFVGVDALVGARGRVEDRLDPRGHVRIGAERWRAVASCDAPLEAGEIVRVLGVTGLELTVEPSSG